MPSIEAQRATLHACLRQNDSAGAKAVLTVLCKSDGQIRGAETWLKWSREAGDESAWLPLVETFPAKVALTLLRAAVREVPPASSLTNVLWKAAGDTQTVMLAVREEDVVVFEQAYYRYKSHSGVNALIRQGLNIAIDRHDAAWAARLAQLCDPTNFHAQRLGQQDVPADSPLLQVFEDKAKILPFRTLSNNFLFPAAHMAIVHGKRGVFQWTRDFCIRRDEAWMAEHPRSNKRHQHIQAWCQHCLTDMIQSGQVAWMKKVLSETPVVDTVMGLWAKQTKWALMESVAHWGSDEQRQAWDQLYGDHLPRLRAEVREGQAQAHQPARSFPRRRA